jgi:hypothetical protein
LKLAEVRLRIPLVLLVSAVIVGRWEVIRNYWDSLTRQVSGQRASVQPVSNDTEYFCPMDPGVVADWPGRCGICNMGLVRRKRGEAVALPDGVVARMQISPYRVQLAGIKTASLSYLPLNRVYQTAGLVRREGDERIIPLDPPPAVTAWLGEVRSVSVRSRDLGDDRSLSGRLRLNPRTGGRPNESPAAAVMLGQDAGGLVPGTIVEVTCEVQMCRLEPFRSMPSDPPALNPGEPRRLFTCLDHPENLATQAGRCPIDRNELLSQALGDHQRVRWWCPMHPTVTADHPGATCKECCGMVLKPRVVSFAPEGKVLAVPEPAVVDSGLRTVVFVETMPGTFDGVEVVLGPRCGDHFPVIRGVEVGQRVAISGAFLLDAETRLNPSLAASYFGATGRNTTGRLPSEPAASKTGGGTSPLAALGPEDRKLAERQQVCPVTGKPLGSMGKPPRVDLSGRAVFLCCLGCEETLRSDPQRYLAKLPAEPGP